MRMSVPSLPGGERTLPAELRTAHVPRGEAYGWHRLHANLAPMTDGPGMHGLGADPSLIPVDPVPMPPVHALPAYTGGGMPTYIHNLISQGLITPQAPPRPVGAPGDAHLQKWPWGYVWAKVVKTQSGPVITWMGTPAASLSGLGQGCFDTFGNPIDCAAEGLPSAGQIPTETTVPVIMNDGSTSGMTPAQIAAMITASSNALTRTLAVTQGGSVSASGNIYGSPQTASIAAGYPAASFGVSGAGVTGILSSPMLLLLIGGAFLLMMSGGRR